MSNKKNKVSSKEVGLEVGLVISRFLYKTEHLHYGFWPDELEIIPGNVRKAQDLHSKLIIDSIPENVETILRHNKGETFSIIEDELTKRGYDIDKKILSPHEFNIPHHRRRVFIVGARKDMGGLRNFNYPKKGDLSKTTIDTILSKKHTPYLGENLYLTDENQNVYNLWNNFIKTFPNERPLPSFPIWSHEWGATYPYEKYTPQAATMGAVSYTHLTLPTILLV